MAFTNRETVRDALVTTLKAITLLANETDGTVHVTGYWMKAPKGINPFCCVDSGSVLYPVEMDEGNQTHFGFVVGFWVRRDSSAATAEDQLDSLALSLATSLQSSYNARFISKSVTDYEVVDGIPYKFELHFIEIDA
jgi:hypothetical protein